MSYEPIARLELEEYGCVRKAALELTRLHALVGPNDSGKSTVLRGLRALSQWASDMFREDGNGGLIPFDPMLGPKSVLGVHYADGRRYVVASYSGNRVQESLWGAGTMLFQSVRHLRVQRQVPDPRAAFLDSFRSTMVRFEPDSLRAPAPLIPDSSGIGFADEKGAGLASVFDAIVNRDVAAFLHIQDDVRRLFPTVDKIRLSNTDNAHKALAVSLVDGTPVDARAMSEGLLYFLAFSALRYLDGSRLFLVEEPENGLHPARIGDVMRVLREISKESQVVIATHSPLVLNELTANEVTVLTRDSSGTHATLIANTPNFAERSQVYSLGELWVS